MNFTVTCCSCGHGKVLKQRNLLGEVLDDANYCQSAPLQRNFIALHSTPRHSWHTNGKFTILEVEQHRWNIKASFATGIYSKTIC